ncbi:GH25 family lysozyme [Devosia sp. RR2S18]|uniref:glycoside hydrolase family 25 protein n=1 Tax=Devosia rhizosphaerae TaxID=3049774 RepID=UPI00253FF7CE|nr:GH25 family lysozyme [Devosia sp. RR2S18]WIJ25349.1 GH25 family lysozyme [Devosia sp. RR2S18]
MPVRRTFPSLAALAKSTAAVALAAILVACSSGGGLYGPIQGDNRPHAGVDRARGMPIQGIDVARYQGNIDFRAVYGSGIHFVFMKATEGKDYLDPNFRTNWQRAKEAGIPRGAYHFMTWCSLASEQAAWFIQNVPADPDALPPVLDLEWNNHSSCKHRPSRADALEKIRVMLDAMERHTGKLPIIYTDINIHRDVMEGEHFPNAFWLRSTAAEPHERYRNRAWTFWQWTQTGVVRGIKGEVDRNAFYGGQNEWIQFLLTGCDPRAIATLGPTGRCRSAK